MSADSRRRNFSEVFTDAVVLAMAVWTVSCHGVVLTGGNLLDLRLVACLGLGMLASLLLARRQKFCSARTAEDPQSLQADPGHALPARFIILTWVLAASIFALALAGWIVLAWVFAVAWLAGALCLLRGESYDWRVPAANSSTAIILGLLAVLCSVWTLFIHRADMGDDPFFVNLAVAAADEPEKPLLVEDTMYGIPGAPIRGPYYRVHSIEMLAATISNTCGVPAIHVSHWGFAAVAGFLLPLVAARLFRLLAPARWLFSLIALLVVLVTTAGASDGYANYAFVRLYQGKAIFASVMVPLIFAYVIEFTSTPRIQTWLMLAAAQVAALGLTSTALWASPATTLLGIVAAQRNIDLRGIQRATIGLLTCSYVIVFAYFIQRTTLSTAIGSIPRLAKGDDLPSTAEGMLTQAFDMNLGDHRFALFATGCVLAGWSIQKLPARQWTLRCVLLWLVVFYNPFLQPFLAGNVTGLSTWWRVGWILPVPVLVALVLSSPMELAKERFSRGELVVVFLAICLVYTGLIPARYTFSPNNHATVKRPSLKVSPEHEVAMLLNQEAGPRQRVAAPMLVAGFVVTFHDHAYPLVARRTHLGAFQAQLSEDDINTRILLQSYISGDANWEGAEELLRQSLSRYELAALCIRRDAEWYDTISEVLQEEQFERKHELHGFEIWSRKKTTHGAENETSTP